MRRHGWRVPRARTHCRLAFMPLFASLLRRAVQPHPLQATDAGHAGPTGQRLRAALLPPMGHPARPPSAAAALQVTLDKQINFYLPDTTLTAVNTVFKERQTLAMAGMPRPGTSLAAIVKDVRLNCLGLSYCK